ncbi:Six-hairpin glycosidase [Aspergillus pseudoustus]|uniref:Six-hairpin glycosidase n=1 Tax=Aspergillus pseudoustus TaxID=1810923 RepID=A0ABR4J8D8_9EURO
MQSSPHFILGFLVAWSYLATGCVAFSQPASYSINGTEFTFTNRSNITLSSDGETPSIIILDYGRNVEGFATFEVAGRAGDTSNFEMSYAEPWLALDDYMSDGPITLSAAMDNYRVNRYNITDAVSNHTNRLIQGALRYQKLNLSTAGELTLRNVGFLPTIDDTPIEKLPGTFRCSDPVLTRIWGVGARTVQMNEFPADSLPNFWVITVEGALVESQSPQPFSSDYATGMTAFDLSFTVKSVRNGFGFTVFSGTLGTGIYIFTELGSEPPLATAALPPSVTVGTWHHVHASVDTGQISVSINDSQLLNFAQSTHVFGSFGLGASFNHAAVFTNLNDKSALVDFLVGTNPLAVSVDGSRRDRIAYAGDLDIATESAFASTAGQEYINGSIALLGSFQMLPGFFIPNAKVQQPPRSTVVPANVTGLIGYSFNLVSAMAGYYDQTGDRDFLSLWAPKAVKMLDWAHSQVLPNGLLNISRTALGGDWNYYDPQVGGVVAKFNFVYAYTLQELITLLTDAGFNATTYTGRLQQPQSAINNQLWSNDLQAYYHSKSYPGFISQEANALAILSDTIPFNGNNNRTAHGLLTMLAFSPSSITEGWAKKISPFASGYHLKAAHLLHTIWGPMSDPQNSNYTGCFWETLDEDGTPGLGLGTSLCHARYVLGIAPVTPGFKQWEVRPQTMGLTWAQVRHPTPQGAIEVNWGFTDTGLFNMTVTAPPGTVGTVYLPTSLRCKDQQSFSIQGGNFTFKQTL